MSRKCIKVCLYYSGTPFPAESWTESVLPQLHEMAKQSQRKFWNAVALDPHSKKATAEILAANGWSLEEQNGIQLTWHREVSTFDTAVERLGALGLPGKTLPMVVGAHRSEPSPCWVTRIPNGSPALHIRCQEPNTRFRLTTWMNPKCQPMMIGPDVPELRDALKAAWFSVSGNYQRKIMKYWQANVAPCPVVLLQDWWPAPSVDGSSPSNSLVRCSGDGCCFFVYSKLLRRLPPTALRSILGQLLAEVALLAEKDPTTGALRAFHADQLVKSWELDPLAEWNWSRRWVNGWKDDGPRFRFHPLPLEHAPELRYTRGTCQMLDRYLDASGQLDPAINEELTLWSLAQRPAYFDD